MQPSIELIQQPQSTVLYFCEDATLLAKQVDISAYPFLTFKFVLCESWSELLQSLCCNPQLIVIHKSVIEKNMVSVHEFANMITTLTKFSCKCPSVPVAIVIDGPCASSFIKELQTAGISGIIPGRHSFGLDRSFAAINELLLNKRHWPKDLIKELTSANHTSSPSVGIKLTNRQSQVLTLICNRGLSNKSIANMLKISESTVKIHASAVLKAYGVRNRTQLALVVNSALKA